MPRHTNTGVTSGIHLGAREGRATSRMLRQKGDVGLGLLHLAPKPQYLCLYSRRVLLQAHQLQTACTSQRVIEHFRFMSTTTLLSLSLPPNNMP